MRSSRSLRIIALCVLPVLGAACSSSGGPTAGPTPTGASTTTPAPTGGPTATTPASSPSSPTPTSTSSVVALGPVWPIEPRTIAPVSSPTGRGTSVLRSIRTSRHGSSERLVLEFTATYGDAKVRYVPVVRQDPSDKVVPLRGTSFLEVVVHGAVARYDATPITPYSGPSTVRPGYPTSDHVTIRVVRPFAATSRPSIVEITDTR